MEKWNKQTGHPGKDANKRLLEQALVHLNRMDRQGDNADRAQYLNYAQYQAALLGWYESRQPYLNLYPALLDGLVNTTLNLMPSQIPTSIIHTLGTIELRTPASRDLPPFFLDLAGTDGDTGGLSITRAFVSDNGQPSSIGAFVPKNRIICEPGEAISVDKGPNFDADTVPEDTAEAMLRVAVGVMMLAGSGDYLRPILLNKDNAKGLTIGSDQWHKAVQRAHHRGKVAFSVGQDLSTKVGFRRAHFAVRWMRPENVGESTAAPEADCKAAADRGLVPVLRPVGYETGGIVVGRDLLQQIPTGYEG